MVILYKSGLVSWLGSLQLSGQRAREAHEKINELSPTLKLLKLQKVNKYRVAIVANY